MVQLYNLLFSGESIGLYRVFRDSNKRRYTVWTQDADSNEMVIDYGVEGEHRVKVPLLKHLHDKFLEDLTIEEFECLAKAGFNK